MSGVSSGVESEEFSDELSEELSGVESDEVDELSEELSGVESDEGDELSEESFDEEELLSRIEELKDSNPELSVPPEKSQAARLALKESAVKNAIIFLINL